jgi:hypothetical protein
MLLLQVNNFVTTFIAFAASTADKDKAALIVSLSALMRQLNAHFPLKAIK